MTEPLDLFATDAADDRDDDTLTTPMSVEQRDRIRTLFAALGITTAREQFDLAHVLVGVRLRAVSELTSKDAAILIPRLSELAVSRSLPRTGNSWDDRGEDTWIDKL